MTSGLSAGELTVRVVSTTGELDKDVQRKVSKAAKAGAAEAEKGTRNITGKMRTIGTGMSLGVTLPLLALGKAARDSASDVIEGTNKVRVVFGEAAGSVEKFAESSAKIGIARSEALAAAGAFGNMFRTVGLANETSATMSTRLTSLAADLGSFHNAMPIEALDAMRSGLNGESEPLRRFGVFLSEARVEAEALASGLAKPVKNMANIRTAQLAVEDAAAKAAAATKKHGAESLESRKAFDAYNRALARLNKEMGGQKVQLTEAQKTQARYNLILKDTKLAHGDVARSASTSAAVQDSIAKANAENAKASLGKALIPLSIAASKAISDLAQRFNDLTPAQQKNVLVALGLLAALGPTVRILAAVGRGLVFAGRGAMALGKGSVAAAKGVAWLVTNGASLVRTLGQMTWQFAKAAAAKARDLAVMAAHRAAMVAGAVAAHAMTLAQGALNLVMSANPIVLVALAIAGLVAAFVLAWRNSETFRRIVTGAFNAVTGAASVVLKWLRRNWPLVLAILMGPFGLAALAIIKNWDRIRGAASGAVQWVRGKLDELVGFTRGLPARISGAAAGMWDGIKDAFRSALNWIIRAWNRLEFRIPGFDPPGPGPKFSGFTLGVPDIPQLADGGIVKHRRGGVLARLAEKGQDEVVAPLARLEAMLGPRTYFAEGAIQINNPAPERASESTATRMRRLAVVGVI